MKVAVVGGGWAGLAAAVELTKNGAAVTLFEAGRVLGGRARSVQIDGRTLDNGQHLLLGAYRDTLALMQQVGVDPETVLQRLPLQVEDDRGFRLALPHWPPPFHLAWGLLTATTVDLSEKLKTALWMQSIQHRHFQLPHDSSVSEWLDQAGQTGTLRHHLWEPLCLAALNTAPKQASAQVFANVLRDSLGSPQAGATDLLIPRQALGEILPEPAAEWLRRHGCAIRMGHRVQTVEPGEQAVAIDGERFDAAILATAPQHLEKLYPSAQVNYTYEPIATVYLQYPKSVRPSFKLRSHYQKTAQWLVDRGEGMLACIISAHGAWENLDDAALTEHVQQEIALPYPVIWSRVIREKRATFSCRPQQTRCHWQTNFPHLRIAGDHTGQTTRQHWKVLFAVGCVRRVISTLDHNPDY